MDMQAHNESVISRESHEPPDDVDPDAETESQRMNREESEDEGNWEYD
jgi:hypothetical protein